MNTTELMFRLLLPTKTELPPSLSEAELTSLLAVAKMYNVVHLVAYGLERCRLLGQGEVAGKFRQSMMLAMWRVEKLNHEYGQITAVLEKAGIVYVPLKGSVVRSLYPEPWMRTSCDIDILVEESYLDSAVTALTESIGYTVEKRRAFHDITLYAPNGIHLELHFNLRERMEKPDGVLDRVWAYCRQQGEGTCCRLLSHEFLMFHTIAHMAYHFVRGGCGIKPFFDLYYMEKALDFDKDELCQLLEEAGISKFYCRMQEVMAVWLLGEAHTEVTKRIGDYILAGGEFGTNANRVAVEREQEGSRGKQILSRIFLPAHLLSAIYPSLGKRPYLMPLYQVARWGRVIKSKRFKPAVKELSLIRHMDEDKRSLAAQILKDVGL